MSGRARAEEFLAPLPLAMVGVMAVNDRWLKPAFDDALTGKLSDVAICFFLPLFVSAVLDLAVDLPHRVRLGLGALATSVVFVPIKTSPAALEVFLRTLEAVGRHVGLPHMQAMVDPTDLVALLATPLAVLWARRRLAPRS